MRHHRRLCRRRLKRQSIQTNMHKLTIKFIYSNVFSAFQNDHIGQCIRNMVVAHKFLLLSIASVRMKWYAELKSDWWIIFYNQKSSWFLTIRFGAFENLIGKNELALDLEHLHFKPNGMNDMRYDIIKAHYRKCENGTTDLNFFSENGQAIACIKQDEPWPLNVTSDTWESASYW